MTTEGCREWRERLGAYVLGHLPAEEAAATRAHIEGCEACRSEAETLRPIARLLPKADPARLGAAPAPSDALGDRIAAGIAQEGRAARERRKRRLAFGISGAAAAAAAAAVLLVIVLSDGSGPDGEQTVVFHDRSMPDGVSIAATLQPRAFGTEISMRVYGVRAGTLCRVFLMSSDGTKMPAGSFHYRYDGKGGAALTSALDLSAADAIGVRAGGRTFIAPLRHGVGAGNPRQPSVMRVTPGGSA